LPPLRAKNIGTRELDAETCPYSVLVARHDEIVTVVQFRAQRLLTRRRFPMRRAAEF